MAAAASADWANAPGFYVILTDSSPARTSWPIAGATFILMPKQPKDPAATGEALKFFAWAYKNGAKMAAGPRLHPDARQRREADRGGLGEGHQGRLRQADLLIALDEHVGKAPTRRLSLVHRAKTTACEAAGTRLEWAPETTTTGSLGCSPPGGETWLIWRCRAERCGRARRPRARRRWRGCGSAMPRSGI